MEKKTKIYLNYLGRDEKKKMTSYMPFLWTGGNEGKQELMDMAGVLYGNGVKLDFLWDNGNFPHEYRAHSYGGDKHFYTIIQFEARDLTEQALKRLDSSDDNDFRWYYAISLCKEDRKLYALSFSDIYSPNWNKEYRANHSVDLKKLDFPLLKKEAFIYRMDDALHAAINSRLAQSKPLFIEKDGEVLMTVFDQHGNYTEITGQDIDGVFLDYANNYTGYRNYRRQMASEWVIAEESVRQRFEEWKKTAKGLKSSFDKFYGGGIVD